MKTLYRLGLLGVAAVSVLSSCSDEQEFTNENTDAKRIAVQQISPEMAKVRDYVPLYACMAHRGSTYWAPEETEAAWRWARNMGADYLESDLQATKDGVVLANHDENLKRTTCSLMRFQLSVRTSIAASAMPTALSISRSRILKSSISATRRTSVRTTPYLIIMQNC